MRPVLRLTATASPRGSGGRSGLRIGTPWASAGRTSGDRFWKDLIFVISKMHPRSLSGKERAFDLLHTFHAMWGYTRGPLAL